MMIFACWAITGALSSTTTLKLLVPMTPLREAEQVTVVVPKEKMLPEVGSQARPVDPSVALTWSIKVTAAPYQPAADWVIVLGTVITRA